MQWAPIGEDLRAAAYEQHRLVSDMAGELGAVGQFVDGNADGQIRAEWLSLILGHRVLLLLFLPALSRCASLF